MSPAKTIEGVDRGFMVPIGGAERKLRKPAILKRFVDICGNGDARIAVMPTASQLDDTGDRYAAVFSELGAGESIVLPILERSDADRPEYLEVLDSVSGIFMTGGNQLRLSTTLGGTKAARRIRRRNAAGMHVGGTSAGAAFMPEHMIAGGKSGATPKENMAQLAPGLGLTNRLIIDQHFRQRDRLGRLLAALAYNPFAVGIGLDEDTAAFIRPDDSFEVVGTGGITVVDPSGLQFSSMAQVRRNAPVSMIGVQLHVLVNGGVYNMVSRSAAAK